MILDANVNMSMKTLRTIGRIVIGLVFIFSGFVKGVDPMGTMFRIEDYFIAFHMEWAMPAALVMTILLCTVEFTVGWLVLLNIRMKIVTWILLVIISGFTVMTFFDAIYNPVPDCGCFGDAIILTNWQTFFKNVVLLMLTLVIVFTRKHAVTKIKVRLQNSIALTVIILFALFCIYSYNRLPVIDFRDWKVGDKIIERPSGQDKTTLVYRNNMTGELREMLPKDLPWQDSTWMSQWQFVESKTDKTVFTGPVLHITDTTGADVTGNFIENPDFQFILVSYNLSRANRAALLKMNEFSKKAEADGYSFIMLTNALNNAIAKFRNDNHVPYEIYDADDIELKIMIRSNPGLILMKNGVVVAKWHFHDFPDYGQVKSKYLEAK
jgi:uncharacterized membrane protein YphA (DoxX/SURF4 family)